MKGKGVFMGDFNIDLLKFGTHQKTNDYINGILFSWIYASDSSTHLTIVLFGYFN